MTMTDMFGKNNFLLVYILLNIATQQKTMCDHVCAQSHRRKCGIRREGVSLEPFSKLVNTSLT